MNDEWTEDELTEDDLEFLEQWGNAGHDSKEHESLEVVKDLPEGHVEIEIANESENIVEGEGDSDDPNQGESDEIDNSKMDISQMDTEDELEAESDDEDENYDWRDPHDMTEPNHLGNDSEEPDEIPEGESDLEYDDLENSDSDSSDSDDNNDSDDSEFDSDFEDDEGSEKSKQIEEEFGDGERADTDSEIEDLDEYEQERDQEINAEGEEDFQGDAQKELEDHLHNEKEKSDGDETQSEPDEPEPLVEQPDENQEEGEEQHSGMFSNLPEAGDLCTNHCEDNPPEESLEETCPHCIERIRKERELHGAIAMDMHGNDILPGDKLHVRIPFGMIAKDSIVTANVPNMEVDPQRLAVTTIGKKSTEKCWLSGKGISNFTGWRMSDVGNAIWTFNKGQQITFAEKIAQPLFDDLDPEKMMEQLQNELDNYGTENNVEQEPEPEEQEINEDDAEVEDEIEDDSDSEEPKEIEEHHERRKRDELSSIQKNRFENLTNRNWKKILGTFGSTVEAEGLFDIEDNGTYMTRGGSIISRGVHFTFGFAARKTEGNEIEEIEQYHKEREEDGTE